MISEKQAEEIKKQLIRHIEKDFPEDKKSFAIEQIKAMSPEELEEFLKRNNLMFSESKQGQCIFCSIVRGEINSYKIDETSESVAVLEINPITKGHILVLPKEHIPDYSKEPGKDAKELIKDVSARIKKKLKPKNMVVASTNLFGHQVVNIIPDYEGNMLESRDLLETKKRQTAKPEELAELQKILGKKEKKISTKSTKPKKITLDSKKIWLPKRIP